ncbi:tRNA lysidine(34) synthetase TilS [Aureibacter tunicatorum]|uniref:tRNA(Ile)-lysidine synthase n=1 Tax=Aureibacter tunicatorum TaxID=866807 RepID=A0AAE3XJ34_9BACT|nr:tRNA lysidine(34) synthetase TilS [Aureibacter tunicatorum]MDR6237663.1 tRNA(Ile)-lysidine synthase [Aureibacter tunicatorum]BDD02698.1 tRNA(Ile)-lysidine synthase [Aureibacter tunicatorum]
MLKEFQAFIKQENLVVEEGKVLLAVSGGMDSVVMLDLFAKSGYSFGIAHCNFGLRGEESDADELFVQKLAKKYKAKVYVNHFDTEAYAEEEKISIEMAARSLRYEWFESLLDSEGYDCLATAHHNNDTLETILFNLAKGTGIAGLHGIKTKAGRTIRPMMFTDRESIMDYTAEKQLIWREDSSNQDNKYRRNLIRNEIVPVLKEINPDLENTIQNTVKRVSAVENIYMAYVNDLKEKTFKTVDGHIFIDKNLIEQESESIVLLNELLKPYGFNLSQAEEILSSRDSNASGKVFHSPTYTLNLDRDQYVLSRKNLSQFQDIYVEEDDSVVEFAESKLVLEKKKAEGYKIKTNPKLGAFDYDKLKFPLKLRKWKAGDWFVPLGMNKKKKLSDFMIDQKIPLNLKKDIFVLTSGNSIVWIVGQRVDNRFKITESTENVLEFKFEKQ